MGYEVDFIGVGKESKSGDAIAIRFGNLYGGRDEQTVVVIDGGFKDVGAEMVSHIKQHFGTDRVDLVISTHPDQDHINGLETVLMELTVNELWMHLPWTHNQGLADKFTDGRITDNSIGERLKESLEKAWFLFCLAEEKSIPVYEPFTGLSHTSGQIRILGPSESYYEELIPQFDGMPAAKEQVEASFLDKVASQLKQIFAFWGEDKIYDDGVTSPKNNSSVITQLIVDGKRMIFTGDAGIEALSHAADQFEQCVNSAPLRIVQIPHHGSRRNVGPTVLNRLLGEPLSEGEDRELLAVASTAKQGEPKHPRKAVLNAFTHRGARVLVTRGNGIRSSFEAPQRSGWSPVDPEPYHYTWEEE
ncbi:ComEC/Rec2 family competence protein [Marinobacterium jannaschii]|uniref:ComEC/Rec2 family competence protein n=1 Tax=Marinobacterium jannaschii TaxID=64970 RepID=UPI0004868D61|nr:MBL fold metallo-hydrolase [Marinobacterium jannaschii]